MPASLVGFALADLSIGPGSTLEKAQQSGAGWMLGWLSDSMQIESLWKYNAKFDPDWHPRYAVYDSAENFLTSAIAVAKAESFWELPLIGRFFAPDESELSGSKQ